SCMQVVMTDVHHDCFLVILLGRGGTAEVAKSAPSPTAAEAVVKRLQRPLRLARLDCHNGNVSAVRNLCQSLSLQLGIHRVFYARIPQRNAGLDFLPGVRFVLSEIRLVIKVGPDVLSEPGCRRDQSNCSAYRNES